MEESSTQIQEESGEIHYFCKVCGIDVFSGLKTRCSNCNAPICEKCDSNGFCLNCFLNLAPDAQSSLKLSKTLSWAVPLLLAFIIRNDFWYWIAGVGGTALFFILVHFYFRFKIIKHPDRYFYPRWLSIVNSDEYKRFIEENNKLRVVSFFQVQKKNTLEQDKIEELKIQADKSKNFSELADSDELSNENDDRPPDIPAYMDDAAYHLSDAMKELLASEAIESEELQDIGSSTSLESKSQLTDKNGILTNNSENRDRPQEVSRLKCTRCKRELVKGNICFECKVRICPSCGEDNRFTSTRCICGYKFEPLENLLED